jgi:hypothetical protein
VILAINLLFKASNSIKKLNPSFDFKLMKKGKNIYTGWGI